MTRSVKGLFTFDFEEWRWYAIRVQTERYSQPNTPLDAAIHRGDLYMDTATTYGQSAGMMWVLVQAQRDFSSFDLDAWADSIEEVPGPVAPDDPTPVTTPEQNLREEERGESTLFKLAEATSESWEDVKDTASDVASAAGSIAKAVAFLGIGFLALSLLRGKK